MRHGDAVAYLAELADEDPTRIPQPLLECPDASEIVKPYIDAFFLLMTNRAIGFGVVGGIPLADMAAYIEAHPFCEPLEFFRVIRAFDALYLAVANKPRNG